MNHGLAGCKVSHANSTPGVTAGLRVPGMEAAPPALGPRRLPSFSALLEAEAGDQQDWITCPRLIGCPWLPA